MNPGAARIKPGFCRSEGVVLEFLAVVEIAVAGDVVISERQAEGIVVRALQDRAAAVDYRPDIGTCISLSFLDRWRCTEILVCQFQNRGHVSFFP